MKYAARARRVVAGRNAIVNREWRFTPAYFAYMEVADLRAKIHRRNYVKCIRKTNAPFVLNLMSFFVFAVTFRI